MLTPYLLNLFFKNLDNNYHELAIRIVLSCLPSKDYLLGLKRPMTTCAIFKMSLLKILKMQKNCVSRMKNGWVTVISEAIDARLKSDDTAPSNYGVWIINTEGWVKSKKDIVLWWGSYLLVRVFRKTSQIFRTKRQYRRFVGTMAWLSSIYGKICGTLEIGWQENMAPNI